MARQVGGTAVLPTRRVVINHESDMPTDYGTTPGGTMFGTTPGGTRIVYERNFLMSMRHSPLAKSPPPNLPSIPGVTVGSPAAGSGTNKENGGSGSEAKTKDSKSPNISAVPRRGSVTCASIKEEDDDQFSMDM